MVFIRSSASDSPKCECGFLIGVILMLEICLTIAPEIAVRRGWASLWSTTGRRYLTWSWRSCGQHWLIRLLRVWFWQRWQRWWNSVVRKQICLMWMWCAPSGMLLWMQWSGLEKTSSRTQILLFARCFYLSQKLLMQCCSRGYNWNQWILCCCMNCWGIVAG